MTKKKVLAVLIAGCLMLQGAGGAVTALAAETDFSEAETTVYLDTDTENAETIPAEETESPKSDAVEAEADLSSTEAADLSSTEEEADSSLPEEETGITVFSAALTEAVETINGIPVDYDDPDCLKYLATHSDEADDVSVPMTLASTSNYMSTWGGTTYFHNDAVAEGMMISPGIDVSKWQGDINWTKVEAAGVEFAFIRLGNSSASNGACNKDGMYTTNMTAAIKAGVQVGVYYYSQAITVDEAKKEAQFVLDNLGDYPLDLPIVMDYEYYGGGRLSADTPDKSTKTQIVQAFCEVIESAGYTACVYASKDFLEHDVNAGNFEDKYQVWLAHWTTGGAATDYSGKYQYWQCADNASVSGISGDVDLDWRYYKQKDIVKVNGTWTYTVNGATDYTYTGLAKNKNGWWYVEDGIVTFNYTGFAENGNGKWYCEDSKVTFKKNDVIKDTTGAIGTKGTWYYVVDSKVQTSYTGVADYKNSNGWWYIKKGAVDFSYTGLAKNKNGWWYVEGGKVRFNYTGFAENSNGKWYCEKSKVTFKKNDVIKDTTGAIGTKGTWYYVVGSKVQTSYTGVANYKNKNGWWYIKNGQVDFTANTVAKNKNGWWYVKDGKVRFTYNGIAENKNGWWYIKKGKVDFSYTGTVKANGVTYSVKKGKVDR